MASDRTCQRPTFGSNCGIWIDSVKTKGQPFSVQMYVCHTAIHYSSGAMSVVRWCNFECVSVCVCQPWALQTSLVPPWRDRKERWAHDVKMKVDDGVMWVSSEMKWDTPQLAARQCSMHVSASSKRCLGVWTLPPLTLSLHPALPLFSLQLLWPKKPQSQHGPLLVLLSNGLLSIHNHCHASLWSVWV